MASPNSSYTDIITTSLANYSGKMADNITNHNALNKQIATKGNQYPCDGGREIVQEMEYATVANVMWYSGGQLLDISPNQLYTAANYNWKQFAGTVTITGLEEIMNGGSKTQVHNLLKSRIKTLEKSLTNLVATSLYATGTGNDGLEFGGLRHIVADTNTNTVGNISASSETWWQNYSANITFTTTTIQSDMNTAWLNLIRGADKPDIICAATTPYKKYWESLTPNQRFTSDKDAGAGFTSLSYAGQCPVIYDDQCPTDHMYFLNTDYLFVRPATGKWMKPLGDRASVNQDAIVIPMIGAGNMTCSNRSLQGVLY